MSHLVFVIQIDVRLRFGLCVGARVIDHKGYWLHSYRPAFVSTLRCTAQHSTFLKPSPPVMAYASSICLASTWNTSSLHDCFSRAEEQDEITPAKHPVKHAHVLSLNLPLDFVFCCCLFYLLVSSSSCPPATLTPLTSPVRRSQSTLRFYFAILFLRVSL